jgi:hypothetical protein
MPARDTAPVAEEFQVFIYRPRISRNFPGLCLKCEPGQWSGLYLACDNLPPASVRRRVVKRRSPVLS